MSYPEKSKLAPGLYLVATPIGNARDVTLRALDILASADVLAAEDTRRLRRLMEIHGVAREGRPIVAYHDHNAARARPRLLADLEAGRSVAYATDAGTPLISDPGFDLLRAAQEAGLPTTTAPGPSAVIAALTLAGLPTDRFLFAGFLPNARGPRRSSLSALAETEATLVFYESPRRLGAMLRDAAETLGEERHAAVCREITKSFEECRKGTLRNLAEIYENTPVKGEIVVLVARGDSPSISEIEIDRTLRGALATMSVRDAADTVSRSLGLKRRAIYQRAMRLKDEGET